MRTTNHIQITGGFALLPSSVTQEALGLTCLSEVSPRDSIWDIHKRQSVLLSRRYGNIGYDKLAERIGDCAPELEFALQTSKSEQELEFKLFNTKFCRVRHCPICQWRKSMAWIARLYEGLPRLINDHPNVCFIFLTLTVRNCDITELRETLKWMNKSWERLSKRKSFPGLGFIKATEITRGEDDTAHPHFHIVIAVKKSYFTGAYYLSQAKWTELWQKSSRVDYKPIVNVKRIKAKDKDDQSIEGLVNALRETVKYSVKVEDLLHSPSDWLVELTRQVHKTRAIALGGIFREYLREEEPEDLISENEQITSGDSDSTIHFGFRERYGLYVQNI